MKIGDIAKLTGRSVQTVRGWENQEWIKKPERDARGWRSYSEVEVAEVIKIVKDRGIIIPHKAIEFMERYGG